MQNIETALKAYGATFDHVVKLSIYMLQGQDLLSALQVSQEFLRNSSNPPAITVLILAGLANPAFLIEMDAMAFIPD